MKSLAIVIVAAIAMYGQAPNADSEAHNPQRLVSPAEYRNIPHDVRVILERRHCGLPEMNSSGEEDVQWNVVSGHFARPSQTDWAALCVVNDRAQAVILWGGKTACSSDIRSGWPFEHAFSQEPAGGLYLSAASAKTILAYRKFFGDAHTDSVTHEGIEVGDEQASLIYYCDGQKWLELQGND